MQPEQCPFCKKCLNSPGTKRMPAVSVFNRLKTSYSSIQERTPKSSAGRLGPRLYLQEESSVYILKL